MIRTIAASLAAAFALVSLAAHADDAKPAAAKKHKKGKKKADKKAAAPADSKPADAAPAAK